MAADGRNKGQEAVYEMDYNPWLAATRGNKGDADTLEDPRRRELLRWQTRARAPTAYEDRLAGALRAIFGDEVHELPGIVARLNDAGIPDPDGAPWTEAGFEAALRELGAP